MRPRIARSVPKVPPREPGRVNKDHRAVMKFLPCLVCGWTAHEGHHLKRGIPHTERGTSRKAHDRYIVPVCRTHHDQIEDAVDDEAWFTTRGIDARSIADALWAARGKDEAMRRVVERSLISRRIYVA
jgi:hypothetical protein